MIMLSFFLTIFLNAISFDAAIRILDLLMLEGSKIIFVFALQMLANTSEVLLKARDEGEAMLILTSYAASITNCRVESSTQTHVYIGTFIEQACKNYGDAFSNAEIETLRLKHRLNVVQVRWRRACASCTEQQRCRPNAFRASKTIKNGRRSNLPYAAVC